MNHDHCCPRHCLHDGPFCFLQGLCFEGARVVNVATPDSSSRFDHLESHGGSLPVCNTMKAFGLALKDKIETMGQALFADHIPWDLQLLLVAVVQDIQHHATLQPKLIYTEGASIRSTSRSGF